MKLCKDCKHYTTVLHYQICAHPDAKRSPTDGVPIQQCFMVRDELIGKCGPEAKWFEQKPPVVAQPKKGLWTRLFGG